MSLTKYTKMEPIKYQQIQRQLLNLLNVNDVVDEEKIILLKKYIFSHIIIK